MNLTTLIKLGIQNNEREVRKSTLILPSDDPLMKQSSVGSTARALTGESWAWKLWRWCLWGSSRMLIQPFLPPVISSCCRGAIESTVAPDSWQQNAGKRKGKGKEGVLRRIRWTNQKECDRIKRSIKRRNQKGGQRGEYVEEIKHQLIIC